MKNSIRIFSLIALCSILCSMMPASAQTAQPAHADASKQLAPDENSKATSDEAKGDSKDSDSDSDHRKELRKNAKQREQRHHILHKS